MPPKTARCRCGAEWRQHGNRTGHCSGCHETFEGITAFDKHQRMLDEPPWQTCLDPSKATKDTGEALFEPDSPLVTPAGARSWRLTLSQKQREALAALKDQ